VTAAPPDEPDGETPPKPEPPVMPTADEAAAQARPANERPAPVRYAFMVWVLAGIIAVLNGIVLLANKQRLVDVWTQNKAPGITDEQVARGATTLLWMFLVAAVVFALLFALFAYKAQEGVRRARVMLTVLCVVTVAFYILILRTSLGLMAAMLSIIATVLLYLPSANVFFRPRDLLA
jgi:cytochrome bd-type quinol oxidase subunit 2